MIWDYLVRYFYWCDRISGFLVSFIGMAALIIFALAVTDKLFKEVLKSLKVYRLFIEFVWHYKKEGRKD